MLRRSTWTLVIPAMRCIGVANHATDDIAWEDAATEVVAGVEVTTAGPIAGVGIAVEADRDAERTACAPGRIEVTVCWSVGSAAAATVAVAPPAEPVSHWLSQGRHPAGVFERVPKRATCCRPGNVTPAGSSRSGVSCET